MKLRKSLILLSFLVILGLVQTPSIARDENLTFLKVVWKNGSSERVLKTWTYSELEKLKRVSQKEIDPLTNEMAEWSGLDFNQVFEVATASLSIQDRAIIDLVILKNDLTKRADIPRFFLTRFSMLLALKKNGNPLGGRGPIYSIVNWSSKPQVFDETLPLQTYFVPAVSTIVLTSYKDQYKGELFTQERSDPLLVRGQKRFFQACMSCHRWNKVPEADRLIRAMDQPEFFSALHTTVKGVPQFNNLDQQGLRRYFFSFQSSPQFAVKSPF